MRQSRSMMRRKCFFQVIARKEALQRLCSCFMILLIQQNLRVNYLLKSLAFSKHNPHISITLFMHCEEFA